MEITGQSSFGFHVAPQFRIPDFIGSEKVLLGVARERPSVRQHAYHDTPAGILEEDDRGAVSP